MLCSIRVCLNLHLPGCYVQFTTNFPRVRHETKKTLSCIISGKNAIAPPTFPEYDTKPKRHYPASVPERMQLHHQLSQSTTRNQKDIILHHFRKECNCTQLFQSTTRNQKDIILHHFRQECNCTTNFARVRHETKKTLSCIISETNGCYVQFAFV